MTAEGKDESPSREAVEAALKWVEEVVVYDPSTNERREHPLILAAAYRQAVARAEAEHKRAEELAEIFSGVDDKGYSWVLRGKAAEKDRDQAVARVNEIEERSRYHSEGWRKAEAERDQAVARADYQLEMARKMRLRINESDEMIVALEDERDALKARLEKAKKVVEAAAIPCDCHNVRLISHLPYCNTGKALAELDGGAK